MTNIHEIAGWLDSLLDTEATPDYPGALNGLQLENNSEITRVAAAVDFSSRAIDGAIANNANLLIVHHGMFWGGPAAVRGVSYRRLKRLFENDIAVYSSHLPLDRHPIIGNNALLARELGLEPRGPFAKYRDIFIGVSGETDIETSVIADRARKFATSHGGVLRSTAIASGRKTRRWAVCSGAGASAETLHEAEQMGIDTLIVGEGPHWSAVHAEEHDLAIIYAGHYATETLGVRALAREIAEKYRIGEFFVNAPTGL
jgi:dinuclear metal center YbgI/SA1388 family protein